MPDRLTPPTLPRLHTYSAPAARGGLPMDVSTPTPADAAAAAASAAAAARAAKQAVWQALAALHGPGHAAAAARWLAPQVQWVAGHPVNELVGPQAVAERFLVPLHAALPDLECRPDLFLAGHWDGRVCGGAGLWVTATGHLLGTLRAPLWGIPAHREPVWLRFGAFFRVEGGLIAEARVLLDLPDLARQAGRPLLPPAAGREVLVPGPLRHDGLLLGDAGPGSGAACLALVEAMIGGLGRFDGQSLASMGMERFWRPDMMWYGPGGIGTARGIDGFQRCHQRPFLHALPDRKGGHHRARFGEGAYAASTGWPSIHATFRGDYLGVPATGQPVTMRVMDWWRAEGDLLAENWVLLDLPHFFLQAGVDLLARARG
jgi:hypothetical protein